MMNDSPTSGPLRGVRVLDLCNAVAGSYSAMLLGDMGADVIKIEPPGGDQARHWGPFHAGEGRFFLAWNRNKRSAVIDLRSERGAAVLRRLAASADVILENFRSGVTISLGVDYDSLREANPRLVYCTTTGFGEAGPMRARPGYDPILQALSGAAAANKGYNGGEGACPVAFADYGTALLAVSGVCAALYQREVSGRGQRVTTSLLQGAMAMQSHAYTQVRETPPEGVAGLYPNHMFRTRDSLIQITAPTNKFWRILCEALELPDLIADEDLATHDRRSARREDLTRRIEARLATAGADHWEALLTGRGIPCAAMRTWDDFFDSPQVAAMEMNIAVPHPSAGEVRMIGETIRFEGTPGAVQSAAPRLGADTGSVLAEAGFSAAEIESLESEGVIRRA